MADWASKRLRKKIFLDPGHGGADDGASVPGNYVFEDELNLSIGLFMDLILGSFGYEIMLSRNRDLPVPLNHRVFMANEWEADIFFSIHNNSYHDYSVSGMGVYIYSGTRNLKTRKLAEIVNNYLRREFPYHIQRGVFEENFYVLRKTTMPAVLVECEFISNPEQAEWLRKVENQYSLAWSLSRSVHEYFDTASKTWTEKKEYSMPEIRRF